MTEAQPEDHLVHISIDLATGKLDLRAPQQEVPALLSDVKEFLPFLAEASARSIQRSSVDPITPGTQATGTAQEKTPAKPKRARKKSTTSSGAKSEKAGQGLGSWSYAEFTPINLRIGDAKEIELAELYQQKSPSNNYEKTAVALWVLGQITGETEFNYDQVYQAMRLASEAKSPSNLSEAVGKLVSDNYVAKGESGIRLKIQGTDWVEKELPKKD